MSVVGMIDWLSLRMDASLLPESVRDMFLSMTGRILKLDSDGEIEWETCSRENIRSDSHQIICKFGSFLEISGSPARVFHKNNVWGILDIEECASAMITFVASHYGVIITRDLKYWDCTRIDITRNYDMGSLEQCKAAIDSLKHVKVGRQTPRSDDNGCGWGYGSSLHMGKAYCKGPHSRKVARQSKSSFSDTELEKADRLLRLEYSVRRHLLKRIKENSGLRWTQFTPEFLIDLHDKYFTQFISEIEVVDMEDILQRLLDGVGPLPGQIPTEGQARSSYDCYVRIRMMGGSVARSTFTKTTWHRHIKNLSSIGIGQSDLQHINVVPLKRRQIVLDQPVSCWDDIKLVQGM